MRYYNSYVNQKMRLIFSMTYSSISHINAIIYGIERVRDVCDSLMYNGVMLYHSTLRFNSCSALTDAGISGLALRIAHKYATFI
jgi:hypothetical protein